MSGGVDSSVAALLLKSAGNECIGCTMKLYSNEDAGISKGHTCCSLDDVEDARSVAYRLGMPYYVFNFSDHFLISPAPLAISITPTQSAIIPVMVMHSVTASFADANAASVTACIFPVTAP